jgi:GNAT superfamily N-acetyltransferase
VERRVARRDELDAISETIALAFATDPVWSLALAGRDGRTDHLRAYWRIILESAVRHDRIFLADDGAAVSVWLPPGVGDLAPDLEDALESLVHRSLDPAALADLPELDRRFAASRASVRADHAYLSLLATNPEHRGRGIGQALLAADLAAWDAARLPTYLESSNPVNDHRYERAGFRPIGGFHAVRDGAPLTMMWRDVGGSAPDGVTG